MAYQLADVLELLFRRISIERILSSKEEKTIYYDDVDLEYLQDMALTYEQHYSDTEMHMRLYDLSVRTGKDGRRSLRVFDVLTECAQGLLLFHNNHVVCRYDKILEWNQIMKAIGEELPVLAVMAERSDNDRVIAGSFTWPPIISHNNNQLIKILDRGMADNHFHLRVSAPYFSISWLNLMNHPWRVMHSGIFRKIDRNYRDKLKRAETGMQKQSLESLVMKAALIRLYLLLKMQNWTEMAARLNLDSLLYYEERMETKMSVVQDLLDVMPKDEKNWDYMLAFAPRHYFTDEEEYLVLSGERWFVYHMLCKIKDCDRHFTRKDYNLFYAYLRIRNELRCELVEANQLVGFENFQIYQSRKNYFTHIVNGESYEALLTRMAVRDVLINPAVRSLEVRISPAKTASDNAESIRFYDNAICRPYSDMEVFENQIKETLHPVTNVEIAEFDETDLRTRFHYVFHFTKKKEEPEYVGRIAECRHYKYRKNLEQMAEQILLFRRDYPEYGRRVVGIDACSQELGCRPEVFGKVFRTLKNYLHFDTGLPYNYVLPQLKVTYHVGEEFLDVTDGLRAIDEAIRFLQLDCGDRIGHALALGVDIEKWYRLKNYQVTLTKQDYLDNIAWFRHMLIKYNIKDDSALKGWLESEYSRYFSEVYQQYIEEINVPSRESGERNIPSSLWENAQGRFDIHTYYLAWLLRGDEPELYKTGKWCEKQRFNLWNKYEINTRKVASDDIRRIPEVSLLYYMYHYSNNVRNRGNDTKVFPIPERYIQGLIRVQKAMQEEIVKRGIAIEMNPSSNVSISVLSGYEEHPIKALFNLGLTHKEEELMNCPQMNVSINTDDKGVFMTRLENEYALLASALEKERNEDGSPKYKREFIYQWLDHIREMGLRQTF